MTVEAAMPQYLTNFLREEDGQDLIEYSLLITFIAIACAAIVGAGRPAVNAVWQRGNAELVSANAAAAGS
jgi:Flp pilus assembly pilin Flp